MNNTEASASWDQRQKFQDRLDNYLKASANFILINDFDSAFVSMTLMQSELYGWMIKTNKKWENDFKELTRKSFIANQCISVFTSNNTITNSNNCRTTLLNWNQEINKQIHKYGLVMQSNKMSEYGGADV